MNGVSTPSLAEQISSAFSSGRLTIPPLPELASRVMELIQDEDGADASELTELIENDAAMTTSILRMANSAAFGGLRVVSELDHAIARLGVRQVGYIVTAVVHKGNFVSGNPARIETLRALWEHALATAVAAKLIAAQRGADRGEAFLAGLLHDTGKLLVLKGVDDMEVRAGAAVPDAILDELLTLLHPELGYGTLLSWKIGAPICRVALDHHRLTPVPDDSLMLCVQAGNAIARKTGAHLHPQPDLDLFSVPVFDALKLDEADVAEVMVQLEEQVAEVHALL